MQLAYGAACLSYSRIQFWFRAFEGGRVSVVDLPRAARIRTGRSEENIQTVCNALAKDRRLTIAAMSDLTGINEGNIQRILKLDLGLVRKCARFVPHLLTGRQEKERLDNSAQMLRHVTSQRQFLQTIVTMDESWVYQYDPEARMHASQWLPKGSDPPVVVHRERATGKVLLITFFDYQGLIYREFLRNRTVTSIIFVEILKRFRRSLRIRRPCLFHNYWLHMDNASPHTAVPTKNFLLQTGTQVLPHPPYSPDLVPNDFFFYPRVKHNIKGVRYDTLEELQDAVDESIGLIPARDYHECICIQWPKSWARCVNSAGTYFEGLHNH